VKEGIYHISELFEGNRIFSIPEYQRNYAWEENKRKGSRQLSEFYEDLLYMSNNKEYFMGTVILRETDEKKKDSLDLHEYKIYEVIDGQQRLTTIIIFIKSAIEILKDKGVEEGYIERLQEIFINKSGLIKLKLSGDDEKFFRNYIIWNQKYPDEIITPSQKRLKKAKEFFKDKLSELSVDEIKKLILKLLSTRILVYPVKDKGDAMLMFETINDRGKPLSNLEKTKSFLMYLVYISCENIELKGDKLSKLPVDEIERIIENKNKTDRLIKLIDEKFGNIYRYMEQINASRHTSGVSEDDIQRYHWVLWFNGEYRGSYEYIDILKEYFRDLILDDKKDKLLSKVEDYVTSLERVFYAFKEVFVDKINEFETLKNIVLLRRVANFYPIIIAAWIKTKDKTDNFMSILTFIEKFIFRVYLIGRKRSDTGITYFYRWASELFNERMSIEDILKFIKEDALYYISDRYLIEELNSLDFYKHHSSQDIRYIFYHYELMLREKEGESLSIPLEEILSDKYTIEHILSQELNPEDRPEELQDDREFENYVNRLGNLVLCSKNWNSSMRNKPFEEKKKCDKGKYHCYQNSIFKCQQKLASYDYFSKNEIEKRQKELIKWIIYKWNF